MYRLILDVDPIPKGRPRFTRGGIAYTPARTRNYETMLRAYLRRLWGMATPLEELLDVELSCFVQQPKKTSRLVPPGDVDNLAKAILDAGNGILWRDDDLICNLSCKKRYAIRGGVLLEFKEVTAASFSEVSLFAPPSNRKS